MKYLLIFAIPCSLFLFPNISFAESAVDTITFVRLNSYVGYVIDSSENMQCHCVNYAGENFSYGSLVQLPDYNIVFRMKVAGRDNLVNVPLTQTEISQLSAKAANSQLTFSDEKAEQILLKTMVDDSLAMGFIDYFELNNKRQLVPGDSSSVPVLVYHDSYFFLNLGIGMSIINAEHLFSVAGTEYGYVRNQRHVFTLRLLWHYEEGGNVYEAGLLYGRKFDAGLVSFTLNAGAMYAKGGLRGEVISSGKAHIGGNSSYNPITKNVYESIAFETFGIPIKAEMLFGNRHRSFASIGLFANFNVRNSYGGILFCLRLSGEYKNGNRK